MIKMKAIVKSFNLHYQLIKVNRRNTTGSSIQVESDTEDEIIIVLLP